MRLMERQLFKLAVAIKDRVAKRFNLQKHIKSFKPLSLASAIEMGGALGTCDQDGNIEVEVQMPSGRLHDPEEILDTVCHELAHLNTVNHGRAWKSTYKKYLKWAKANLI